jgi:hypothetical protein
LDEFPDETDQLNQAKNQEGRHRDKNVNVENYEESITKELLPAAHKRKPFPLISSTPSLLKSERG